MGIVPPPEHYTVTQLLNATCDPGGRGSRRRSRTSRSVSEALFVQQKKDQSESRTNWTRAVPRALGRRDIVVAWRSAVKIYTGVSKKRGL
jgi:hypothetical protein